MSLARQLSGLSARFDRLALRPPAAAPDEAATLRRHADPARRLLDWCHAGAGPGRSGVWRPGAQPAVALRLAVAALRARPGDDAVTWVDALARGLDGGSRLDALAGRGQALAWRLCVKAHDAMWWRARQRDDPWDAGWAVDTPPALRQLKSAFVPRRATLILADAHAADALRPGLAALVQRSDFFGHPVRWLWVGGDADMPEQNALAVERFVLG